MTCSSRAVFQNLPIILLCNKVGKPMVVWHHSQQMNGLIQRRELCPAPQTFHHVSGIVALRCQLSFLPYLGHILRDFQSLTLSAPPGPRSLTRAEWQAIRKGLSSCATRPLPCRKSKQAGTSYSCLVQEI